MESGKMMFDLYKSWQNNRDGAEIFHVVCVCRALCRQTRLRRNLNVVKIKCAEVLRQPKTMGRL